MALSANVGEYCDFLLNRRVLTNAFPHLSFLYQFAGTIITGYAVYLVVIAKRKSTSLLKNTSSTDTERIALKRVGNVHRAKRN